MSVETQASTKYRNKRRKHWNNIVKNNFIRRSLGGYYHSRIEKVFGNLISPNLRVLEIGSGTGYLLASLKPSFGLGIDISEQMLLHAKGNHPELHFVQADGGSLPFDTSFDMVILSDLLNDVWDVQEILRQITKVSHAKTRVIINGYSRVWQIPLLLAQATNLATPLLPQNWLTPDDLKNLLELENFEPIRSWGEVLAPLNIPLLTSFCNRYLAKLWPFNLLVLSNFIVGRKQANSTADHAHKKVSVIVPARNEAGNIAEIFKRVPEMGTGTELIFVEGHSKDDTFTTIQEEVAKHPQRECQFHQQDGRGKGDAVRKGFAAATGDILMILDADLTVPPEMLPRFYEVLRTGKGDFANGVRLVYPMEDRAMRFLNFLGNKFFSLAFSWLLEQPIKDTLCGTKVLSREDYEQIATNRSYFGDFDPFGDFDLLFGSARQNYKIVEVPIRYRERTYGDTNIDRWRHGALLLRMVFFAARRIKFI
ncbi:MAG: glycosyltransferase [Chloroflexi bacterium]|nr:MAG: glycosyltransferase [Chloroflexota bacterium]MBL1193082.1 glycosyltransferase [Chloroflexota bacterium]NOH10375.1 glycosyltransferase [Chloroflexota bacterium]